MKLSTNLDIVNGLSTCRDMFEAKDYLKANNIDISDQELEILQSHYSKINSERTLTKELLNKVAGGGKSWHGGSPRTKSLDAGRPRSLSASDVDFNFFSRQDVEQRLEAAERRWDGAAGILHSARERTERTAEEERAKTIQFMHTFPGMQEFYKEFLMTDMMQGLAEDACQKDLQVKELTRLLTETRLQLNKTQEREQSLRQLVYRMRGLNPHGVAQAREQVSSLLGQECGRTSMHYAPTPVPSSVPDPEPAPKLKPTYSIDPKPIEKSSSFSSRMPVVRVNGSGSLKDGSSFACHPIEGLHGEGSLPISCDVETDSDTSPESTSPPESSAHLHMGNPLLQKNLA